LVQLVGRAISTQSPGVEQVAIKIEFVLHLVDAGTDGAEQTALDQDFRRGGRFFGGCRSGCGSCGGCGSRCARRVGSLKIEVAGAQKNAEHDDGLEIRQNAVHSSVYKLPLELIRFCPASSLLRPPPGL